ncbi:hypothetical protein [Kiloniella sp.]|uniref:hypothetical protein n=1 Tax=Kiloniella sp. TaxID=1938587 RepID=UPI003B0146BA
MKSDQNIAEYSKNNILILPEALLEMKDAKCLMHHGSSAIFYKDLDKDLVDIEFFCNVPCFVYIKSGRERITSCDGNTHQMEEGSLTFLPQGVNLRHFSALLSRFRISNRA